MSRLVEVFCATQRHQKTKNKKQKNRNADKGSHGFTHRLLSFFPLSASVLYLYASFGVMAVDTNGLTYWIQLEMYRRCH